MSRIVLMNRLAEELKCTVSELPQGLTTKQMYWMIQHERMHKRYGYMTRLNAHVKDMTINPVLFK